MTHFQQGEYSQIEQPASQQGWEQDDARRETSWFRDERLRSFETVSAQLSKTKRGDATPSDLGDSLNHI
jgi:hypothetical protein